ncbi:MAG TPA: hypothetical protein VNI01_01885 [Elusimicrobiota bacterium]|nr:hypothetical protein [Elusimicrobiota bacterium]
MNMLLAVALTFAAPPARAGSSAEVYSLQVQRRSADGEGGFPQLGQGASTMVLGFLLRAPGCLFMGLPPDALRTESYSDDKGQELGMGVGIQLAQGMHPAPMTASEQAIPLTLSIQRAPPPGTLKIRYKGEASLTCADGAKKSRTEKADLKKSAVVESGPFVLRFAPMNPNAPNSMLRLDVEGPLRQLAHLRITDSTGRELQNGAAWQNTRMMRFNAMFGGAGRPFQTYIQSADSANVELEWYEKTKTVQVPVLLETGIGL